MLFFVRVNQVLVRLWARRGRMSDRTWSVSDACDFWHGVSAVSDRECVQRRVQRSAAVFRGV